MPILFNYRHGIELTLKGLIRMAARCLVRDAYTQENLSPAKLDEKLRTHNIRKLADRLDRYMGLLQIDAPENRIVLVDFRGVPWGCGERAIVGQQGEAEGLGECDVHRVIGAEVVAHLERPRLQWLHRMADDPQAGVVGEHLQRPLGANLDSGFRRGGQAAHDAGDLGVDEGWRVHGPG